MTTRKQPEKSGLAAVVKKGWEAVNAERQKQDALIAIRKEKSAPRFWLKEGEEAEIMFLDQDPCMVWEHKIELNGRWETLICTREFQHCPICEAFPRHKPGLTAYLSIIDTRPYMDRQGTQVKFSKKLFPMKAAMQGIVYDILKEQKSLKYLLCRVKRYSAKSASGGDYLAPIRRIKDPLKVVKSADLLVPFDYEKVFQPLTSEELTAMGIFSAPILGSEDAEEVLGEVKDASSIFDE